MARVLEVLEVLKIAVDIDASIDKFVNCTGNDKVQSRGMPKTRSEYYQNRMELILKTEPSTCNARYNLLQWLQPCRRSK